MDTRYFVDLGAKYSLDISPIFDDQQSGRKFRMKLYNKQNFYSFECSEDVVRAVLGRSSTVTLEQFHDILLNYFNRQQTFEFFYIKKIVKLRLGDNFASKISDHLTSPSPVVDKLLLHLTTTTEGAENFWFFFEEVFSRGPSTEDCMKEILYLRSMVKCTVEENVLLRKKNKELEVRIDELAAKDTEQDSAFSSAMQSVERENEKLLGLIKDNSREREDVDKKLRLTQKELDLCRADVSILLSNISRLKDKIQFLLQVMKRKREEEPPAAVHDVAEDAKRKLERETTTATPNDDSGITPRGESPPPMSSTTSAIEEDVTPGGPQRRGGGGLKGGSRSGGESSLQQQQQVEGDSPKKASGSVDADDSQQQQAKAKAEAQVQARARAAAASLAAEEDRKRREADAERQRKEAEAQQRQREADRKRKQAEAQRQREADRRKREETAEAERKRKAAAAEAARLEAAKRERERVAEAKRKREAAEAERRRLAEEERKRKEAEAAERARLQAEAQAAREAERIRKDQERLARVENRKQQIQQKLAAERRRREVEKRALITSMRLRTTPVAGRGASVAGLPARATHSSLRRPGAQETKFSYSRKNSVAGIRMQGALLNRLEGEGYANCAVNRVCLKASTTVKLTFRRQGTCPPGKTSFIGVYDPTKIKFERLPPLPIGCPQMQRSWAVNLNTGDVVHLGKVVGHVNHAFRNGDVFELTVDLDSRSLKLKVNETDLGAVVTGIISPLSPAVSLGSRTDSFVVNQDSN